MLKKILSLVVAGVITVSCGATKVTVNNKTIELEDGIYAKLTTNRGDILMDFYEDLAPMTAANFIALAEGN
ncbi:MAG TPA: peptidylprolyl isomerase, partial [Cryomorphaceae bacterium]|nr:peptidylprolyl isomerase [Cryomorphaceae bacterium]